MFYCRLDSDCNGYFAPPWHKHQMITSKITHAFALELYTWLCASRAFQVEVYTLALMLHITNEEHGGDSLGRSPRAFAHTNQAVAQSCRKMLVTQELQLATLAPTDAHTLKSVASRDGRNALGSVSGNTWGEHGDTLSQQFLYRLLLHLAHTHALKSHAYGSSTTCRNVEAERM